MAVRHLEPHEMSEFTFEYELLIIGAGMTGLVSAKRYLDAHPQANIAILEKEDQIGGVFSRKRNHSNFWTQWSHGQSGFAEEPIPVTLDADIKNGYYKSKYVTEYLELYAKRIDTQRRNLRDRVKFNMAVQYIRKNEGQWHVLAVQSSAICPSVFKAPKLIVASGLDTHPNIPHFEGEEDFTSPVIHSIDFGALGEPKLADPSIQNITVLGAGKSSADMIYEAVTKYKKNVTWVIRKSGTGPAFFADGRGRAGYASAFELASTRIISYLGPSIWYGSNWWIRFINGSRLGLMLQRLLMGAMDRDTKMLANYRGRRSGKGFEGLEYDVGMWWQAGPGGLIHHDDFWEVIAKHVQVYREEVSHLSERVVHLADGTAIPTDMLLAGTGWIPSLQFFDEERLTDLGLPHKLATEPENLTEKWQKLESEADVQILKDFPILADPPPHFAGRMDSTPYRLYNGMAPIGDQSILILNHIITGNKMLAAEVQAMWAASYFKGDISLPSPEVQEKEVARMIAYSKRRYLSSGQLGNAMNFDTIMYADHLLGQMGLSKHVQKGVWPKYLGPVTSADMGKAWHEYLRRGEEPVMDICTKGPELIDDRYESLKRKPPTRVNG